MPDEYPLNIVWMIECRYWPDSEDYQNEGPEAGHTWKRYAPAEPSGFGSGIVVQLEQRDAAGAPLKPPQIKNYLLTCGHVVRTGGAGAGPAAKEILCWMPGESYHRTLGYDAVKNEGRLKGQIQGGLAFLAAISPLSPCGGRRDRVPPEMDHKPHLDWVLLELQDPPDRPGVDVQPCLRAGARGMPGDKVHIIGYPDGAGWEKDRETWTTGGHYLPSGEDLRPHRSREEEIAEAEAEMLTYGGAVEARAGMSGGGVFRSAGNALVGLHRSRHDASLSAEALSYADIIEWLRKYRQVWPVYPPPDPGPRRRNFFILIAAVCVLAVAAVLAVIFWPSLTRTRYIWQGRVVDKTTGKPLQGVTVVPRLNNKTFTELQATTRGDGEFEITTTDPDFHRGKPDLVITMPGYKPLSPPVQALSPGVNARRDAPRIFTLEKTSP